MPRAAVTFLKDDKEPAVATTDENGAYEIDLTKGEGWTVSLKAPGRRRGQVLEVDPPYQVRDDDERRAALEHISDGDLSPAPVGWKRSLTKVRLDLIAVPYRWYEPSQH